MSFKIRAAAVTVATSLVAVPLALSGTALAQDDQPTGYIGGTVFNDYNGDGVKQDNESGLKDVNVMVKGPDGQSHPSATDAYGTWTVKRTPYGQYEVTYVDPKLGNTTPATVKAEVKEGDTPAVNFGVRGGSICGVAWIDANEDGKRQADEGPLADKTVYAEKLDRGVESGTDGRFCFDNLAAGDYTLAYGRKSNDPHVLTKPVSDSKFDWVSNRTQPIKVGKGEQVKGIDAGFLRQRGDLKAVQVIIDDNGQIDSPRKTFKVGEVIGIYGGIVANGNAPQALGGTLTLPEGLRILHPDGGLGKNAVVQGRQVIQHNGYRQWPGLVEWIGAKVVVEKEFTGGEIKFEAQSREVPDVDLTNNVATRTINAEAAPVHNDAPNTTTPEVKKTAALANTGADPVALSAIGLGVVALGGLALYGARRRRNV